MRKIILAAACALTLAGCSTDASQKFQQGLATFRSNVAAVNVTIAEVSADLSLNCLDAETFGMMLEQLAPSNSKAKAGFDAVNAGIMAWCQKPPTNIQTAVAATAQIVAKARAAYDAARSGGTGQ